MGCGGYKPPPLGACGEGTPVDDDPCPTGSFIATDRCFPTLTAACECLSCSKKRCRADNSKPADVTCGAAEPTDDLMDSVGDTGASSDGSE